VHRPQATAPPSFRVICRGAIHCARLGSQFPSKVGDQEIGLDPNGHNQGMTGPVSYYHVSDIKNSLQSLLDAGAQAHQEVRDVGGGKLIASVKDADSNIIGLIQLP
jgi:predicted enzyme related to lactoylglutathione lyase